MRLAWALVSSGGYLHGCWMDEEGDPAMKGMDLGRLSSASPHDCIALCGQHGFNYAGVENRAHCFCDNMPPTKGPTSSFQCRYTCDDGNLCGGSYKISLYTTNKHAGVHRNIIAFTPPTRPAGQPAGQEMGCWKGDESRLMEISIGEISSNSKFVCIEMCHQMGFPYAGIQDKNQCFCASSHEGHLGYSTECTMTCDDGSICGGSWAISVYTTYKFEYLGCWKDTKEHDAMPGSQAKLERSNSVHYCIAKCTVLGYLYAGMQNREDCFCSNKYNTYGRADSDLECDKCRALAVGRP
eukprot:GHVU01010283.1.p1 GENE.GHVU01010283.1~~GHVU01010283.1.p1  ORF type:complete len:296 (+),score=23.93 GHVU01010283.1:67-954(+)